MALFTYFSSLSRDRDQVKPLALNHSPHLPFVLVRSELEIPLWIDPSNVITKWERNSFIRMMSPTYMHGNHRMASSNSLHSHEAKQWGVRIKMSQSSLEIQLKYLSSSRNGWGNKRNHSYLSLSLEGFIFRSFKYICI